MNTHWIDYIPGTAARVTDKEPDNKVFKQTKDKDVNRLSRIVCNFNDWLNYRGGRKLPFNLIEATLHNLCRTL
jgi:hypothetical protein